MEIKKTTGQPGEHGKDYLITTTCDCEFLAERNPGASTYCQYELGIDKSTLSGIKEVIEKLEEYPNVESDDSVDEPENYRTVFQQGPRAESLLALLHTGEHVDRELILTCLDNAGYVDPATKQIDLGLAQRDVKRNSNETKSENFESI